jgi:hypothetical protein
VVEQEDQVKKTVKPVKKQDKSKKDSKVQEQPKKAKKVIKVVEQEDMLTDDEMINSDEFVDIEGEGSELEFDSEDMEGEAFEGLEGVEAMGSDEDELMDEFAGSEAGDKEVNLFSDSESGGDEAEQTEFEKQAEEADLQKAEDDKMAAAELLTNIQESEPLVLPSGEEIQMVFLTYKGRIGRYRRRTHKNQRAYPHTLQLLHPARSNPFQVRVPRPAH